LLRIRRASAKEETKQPPVQGLLITGRPGTSSNPLGGSLPGKPWGLFDISQVESALRRVLRDPAGSHDHSGESVPPVAGVLSHKDLSLSSVLRFAGSPVHPGGAAVARGLTPAAQPGLPDHIQQRMQPCWDRLKRLALEEVEATLEALPKPLQKQARSVTVTLERRPGRALLEEGYAPDTLGMFAGAPFAEEGLVPLPPQIILFLLNLWDFAGGNEEIYRQEVRTTYLHELGHYLGLSEEELSDRGLE
jgi:predicted Zn-dependent protease with MMP-like domain